MDAFLSQSSAEFANGAIEACDFTKSIGVLCPGNAKDPPVRRETDRGEIRTRRPQRIVSILFTCDRMNSIAASAAMMELSPLSSTAVPSRLRIRSLS